jgi:hypothetical protein
VFHGDEYNHELVDWELIFPLPTPATSPIEVGGGRRLLPRLVTGVTTMASLIHEGPYPTLNRGYRRLAEWVQRNGFEISGAVREVYLKLAIENETEVPVTEIQFPVNLAS